MVTALFATRAAIRSPLDASGRRMNEITYLLRDQGERGRHGSTCALE